MREQVCSANKALRSEGLVTMHSGNVSGVDGDIVYIKPSGMDYDLMKPESMVPVSLSTGMVVGSELRPSVDLPHHLFLYRNDPAVRAVVHTHSNYATAFAAQHRSIPLVLTAIADEFGGEIPCTPYIDNEGENIGLGIFKYRTQAPAILLGNHGVFAWGGSVKDALKAAVMVEDVAKTAHLAYQLGEPLRLDPDEALKWWDRYHNRYGQS
ncbi:MAG: class II aldolase/adducin family protein [Chlorobia bacterium]|nr:class II aldolase/adducin family protein [Fimbriimonadaceae bacterium]